ncbi:MAG: SDR family NAD(P)-dependent oxidoreductase, partial [Acidimicrobiia bacterium]|nr:SDR family NAD(P)-dependent oxidoreductase [Acidimicrobiia bacterium]
MDLGIAGRHAVLMASSRGLGRACAESLAREGVNIVVNGRDSDDVERAVAELREQHHIEV